MVQLVALAAVPCVAQVPIFGTVQDEQGRAVERGRAELRPVLPAYEAALLALDPQANTAAPVDVAALGPAGRFRLLSPGPGLWTVTVRSPGKVAMVYPLIPLLEPRALPPLRLVDDQGLALLLTSAAGPVPLAQAQARSVVWPAQGNEGWRPATRLGRSDADGNLRLSRAAAERVEVLVQADGYRGGSWRQFMQGRIELQALAETPPAWRLQNRRGEPQANVLAILQPEGWPVGLSDAEGRLQPSLPLEPGQSLQLLFATGRHQGITVPAPEESQREASLPVADQRVAHGRLVGAGREGLAGAWVWPAERPDLAVRSDGSGRFALWLAPGSGRHQSLRFRIAAQGYLLREELRSLGTSRLPERIEMQPASSVLGRVVDPEGQPLPGVEIRLLSTSRRAVQRVWSAADGRFLLGQLRAGRNYTIELVRADLRRLRLDLPPLEPFERRGELRLVMTEGGLLLGRVVGPSGEPVAEAEIDLLPSQLQRGDLVAARIGDDEEDLLTTDVRGRFVVPITETGLLDLYIKAKGYSATQLRGVLVSAEERLELGDLVLDAAARLNGWVGDTKGEPLGEVEVFALTRPVDRTVGLDRMLRFGRPAALSRQDGQFFLEELPAQGVVQLFFRRRGYSPLFLRGVEVPGEEELRVQLQPAARLAGWVVDPEGRGVRGAELRLQRLDSNPSGLDRIRRLSDGDGYFSFSNLWPGQVRLLARSKGYPDQLSEPMELQAGVSVEDLEIRLRRGVTVEGRVMDRRGEPVAGAWLLAHQLDAQAAGGPGGDGQRVAAETQGQRSASSDSEGWYQLPGLRAGQWRLVASHNRVETEQELQIGPEESENRRQDLVLGLGGEDVFGTVVDPQGGAVEAVLLRLVPVGSSDSRGGTQRSFAAVSAADGSLRFVAVSAGTYRVQTGPSPQGVGVPVALVEDPGLVEVDGDPEQPVPFLRLVVGLGATIQGRVLGLAPRELLQVEVEAHNSAAVFARGPVRLDSWGGYELRGLGVGAWTVSARIPGTGRRASAAAQIQSDSTTVSLDLDFSRGQQLAGTVRRRGEALINAQLVLIDSAGQRLQTRTDYLGRFLFQGLSASNHRLELWWGQRLAVSLDEVLPGASGELQLSVP